MIGSLAVVAAIVLVMVVLNYRAPQDPVMEVDPLPAAQQVASVAGYPIFVPTDAGWRPTAARWEKTGASQGAHTWFVGGVYSANGPFAALSQSEAVSQQFIAEQTGQGTATGESADIGGQSWQRYESADNRSLVHASPTGSVIVTGTGSWSDVERFAASLRVVDAPGANPQAPAES